MREHLLHSLNHAKKPHTGPSDCGDALAKHIVRIGSHGGLMRRERCPEATKRAHMRTLCCAVVMLLAGATVARSQSMTPDAAVRQFVPVDELHLEADEGLSVCSDVWV